MAGDAATQLATFLPALLRARLAAHGPATEAADLPLSGALLFADVSGFSKLTERFASNGPQGAERISACLNTYFANLIGRIESHGGDVFKFAGDALLAFWADDANSDPVHRAAACGLEIQREMGNVLVAEDVALSTRLGIGCGDISLLLVGGERGRWETLPLGDPFRQLRATHAKTQPGDLAVSPEAWSRLQTAFGGRPIADGIVRVERELGSPPRLPLQRPDLGSGLTAALRAWVPGAVTSRLDAGLSQYLGELRRVSVVFAGLPVSAPADQRIERIQPLMRALQRVVYGFEGAINKISVDDKGAVLVAVFGLPPFAHEDDAVRATRAALGIQTALRDQGLQGSIGIATGQVFCGTIGGETRREYTVMGHVVNLASRLMEAAKGGILADGATHAAGRHKVSYAALPAIVVKGRAEPVDVYAPSAEGKGESQARTPLVARIAEQDALKRVVDAAVQRQPTATGIVVADAGMGKSRLTEEICAYAQGSGVRIATGAGLPVERNIAWRAFRPLVEDLLGLTGDDAAQRRQVLVHQVAALDGMAELAPLLDAIVPVGLDDNDRTRLLQGEARARQTHELVARLAQAVADTEPLLLVIEDAHWLDSASWQLLADLQQALQRVAILVATRPLPAPEPEPWPDVCDAPNTTILRLKGLDAAETARLAAQRLGVAQIPQEAASLIARRAEGNALYIEELAHVLRDRGCLHIDGEACELAVPVEELSRLPLPDNVQGLIVSRVDRLEPRQQLALKVGSVIDRLFALEVLQGVYPNADERPQLPAWMPALVTADMLRPEDIGGRAGYLFKHVLTQEAVYGLMLFAQRRSLHRAVAEFYEARGAGTDYAVLAHHWQGAEDWPKAVQCIELAGEQALKRWASREAITFFVRAQDIDDQHHVIGHDPLRRARWLWSVGEASFRLGLIGDAERLGRQALQLAGRPVPTTTLGATTSFLYQVCVRVWRKYFGSGDPKGLAHQRSERLWATNILNRLTEIHIYRENPPGLLDSALRELNTAEPVGPSGELGRAYAILTVVFATIPLAALCKAWARRAIEIAEVSNDPAKLSYVTSRLGVYHLCVADWPSAERDLRRSADLARDFGDRRLRIEALSVLGYTMLYQGKLDQMEPLFAQVGVLARQADDAQIESWHHAGGGACLLRLGRTADAVHNLEIAARYKAASGELITTIGLFSLALWRSGDKIQARKRADEMYPLVAGKRPVAYWTQHGLNSLNQVYLALWDEAAPGSPEAAHFKQRAKAMADATVVFAKIFPFGLAQGQLFSGTWRRRAGDAKGAEVCLRKAIDHATTMGQPYELGLAWRELAFMPGLDKSEARTRLVQAAEVLAAMGARYDEAEVRDAIARL